MRRRSRTIQDRGYVEKIEKKYHPTEIGTLVNDLLVANFPEIVDLKFTSHIEEELDDIAEGKMKWTEVCREFYGPFKKELDEKEASVEKQVEISDDAVPALRETDGHQVRPHGEIPCLPRSRRESDAAHARRSGENKRA